MTVNDVADLLFAARERVDFYWNFFVVVVVAVIGWLVALKRPLPLASRALVSVVYLIAAATNLFGLASSYAIAEALRTDLLRLAAATPLADTRALLEQHSYLAHRTAAIRIHVVVAAAILSALWLTRPGESEAPAADASPTST
jgi:hypothetical protein